MSKGRPHGVCRGKKPPKQDKRGRRPDGKQRTHFVEESADQDNVYATYHLSGDRKKSGVQSGTVKGGGPNLLGRDWLEEIRLDWEAIFQIVRDNPRSPLHELLSKY